MPITEVIQKTPGVSGGHACIPNTRISVWTLVSLRLLECTKHETTNRRVNTARYRLCC